MTTSLYRIFLSAYWALAKTLAKFQPKAKLFVEGRSQALADTQKALRAETAPLVWFHCASLGEFEQGRPLIEALKKTQPDTKILLSFFSPSGYEIRKNYPLADYVCYLPFDFLDKMRDFVQAAKPRAVFIVKYEVWPNLMRALKENRVPAYLISALFHENQIYFRPYGGIFKEALFSFDKIFVQDEASRLLLLKNGYTNAVLAGDTRFDRVSEICRQSKELPLVARFAAGKTVLVIGSCWPQDLEAIVPALLKGFEGLKIIVAPHETDPASVKKTLGYFEGKKCVAYSAAETANLETADLLIIDNVGMLSSVYRYGHIAYIGGAFGKGLHNILEAATFGLPLLFGPRHGKFPEALRLIALGAAFGIRDGKTFQTAFAPIFADEALRLRIKTICQNYVMENAGAVGKISGGAGG